MKFEKTARIATVVVIATLAATAFADTNQQITEPVDHRDETARLWLPESIQVSDHTVFNSSVVVNGATSLVRDHRRQQIEATIATRALQPDTAYSIWWAVFNQPRFCIAAMRCSLADLGADADPRARPSVFWGGGFVSDAYGVANAAIRLGRGRTRRELFANTKPYGLENVSGAEIHVVLRSHGPVGVAGTVAAQIGTATEACPVNGCTNVFASVHLPAEVK